MAGVHPAMNYQTYVARYLPSLETYMKKLLTPPARDVSLHYDIMAYHLGWRDEHLRPAQANTGKRIRPVLCLLACEAVGGDPQSALPAAAGIELLHNFSLIHDDIEDNSPTRRGRPTVWRLWGVAQAINVGDAMFSLARWALHDLRQFHPAERVLEAFQLFDQVCLALTEGQHLDMCFEERLDVNEEAYMRMIRGKTAALIATSVEMGALLGGAPSNVRNAYKAFGENLGLAFQIQDDILGIWGQETKTGKSTASDILSKKKTWPVIYALHHPTVGPTLRELYAGPPFTEADVPRVQALLEEAGTREAATALVHQYHEKALAALDTGGVRSPAQDALRELANALLGREA